MNPYDELKQQLLEIKHESEQRLDQFDSFGLDIPFAASTSSGELSQYDNHPADTSTALYEREKDLALRRQLEEELRDVNQALQKMEEGTYGICEVTGEPIPIERLHAIPTARTTREASPDQAIYDYRPVEEDVLYHMEKEYDTGSEETEYNEQDAYQIVASYNELPMTYEGSSLIDNEDGMGYVEPVEAIASTDMEGYEGEENVQFQRNIQYDQWMNDEDLENLDIDGKDLKNDDEDFDAD
jgi:YteA family regulatory protein